MNLNELRVVMSDYNNQVAYGSECAAWGNFVNDSYAELGMAPWDDRAEETEVPEEMADYWVAVSENSNGDYNDSGDRV